MRGIVLHEGEYVGRFGVKSDGRSVVLSSLAALARMNRRLWAIVTLILYRRGIQLASHHPLARAAKHGLLRSLKMALGNGADPNFVFGLKVDARLWNIFMEIQQAELAWQKQDRHFFPPFNPAQETRHAVTFKKAMCFTTDLDLARRCRNAKLHPQQKPRDNSPWDSNDLTTFELRLTVEPDFGKFPPQAITMSSPSFSIMALTLEIIHSGFAFANHSPVPQPFSEGSHRPPPPAGDRYMLRPCEWAPLHLAICSGHIEIAKLLIDHGANVLDEQEVQPKKYEDEDSEEDTPSQDEEDPAFDPPAPLIKYYGSLFQAAATGYVEILRHMLDAHPEFDLEKTDAYGLTAHAHACIARHLDTTVPFLLSRRANINVRIPIEIERDVLMTTLLGLACRRGLFEDAIRLIDLGIDTAGFDLKKVRSESCHPHPSSARLLHGFSQSCYPLGKVISSGVRPP